MCAIKYEAHTKIRSLIGVHMDNNYEAKSELEVSLKEIFFELKQNWVMIAVSSLVLAVIVFLYTSFLVTPKYQSTSKLYVLSKSTSITAFSDIQIGTYLTRDYVEVVSDRPVLDKVIELLDLDITYKQLKGMVKVTNPQNTRIIEITITDSDPKRAKEIADKMADVSSAFIAEKMDQQAPNVLRYSYSDGGIVSPNIGKSTILGAAVGFSLAMILIILRYLLSDTMMSAEDVERKLGLSVLGMLPMENDIKKEGR